MTDRPPQPEIPADLRVGSYFTDKVDDLAASPFRPATIMQALMEAAPGDEPLTSLEEVQPLREAVAECLALTDPHTRFVMEAVHSERLSFRQLADRLGVSKSQAHRDYRAAEADIRALLSAHPVIQERIPELQPSTWDEAAAQAITRIRMRASTSLPRPLDMIVEDAKNAVSNAIDPAKSEAVYLSEPVLEAGQTAWSTLVGEYPDGAERLYDDLVRLMVERHHKYGVGNILTFREVGLLVRICDKIARIKNNAGDFHDESAVDAWMDLVGYAAIAEMLDNGTFHLPLAPLGGHISAA